MKSVYIHIPFCKTICTYCDFPKLYKEEAMIDNYLNALKNEVKEYYNEEEIYTIYIGGGTPSCLNSNQLLKLKEIIDLFKFNNLEEFTFECNIEDISPDLIDYLKTLKVTRLSIGIQSFNKDKLSLLGRNADFKDALEKINLLKENNFNNINLDLIYGLPNERLSDLRMDLKKFLKLKPTHLSTYSLIIEENTILGNNRANLAENTLEYKMYQMIIKKLKKNHFNHYEISNFSLEGKSSKHNLIYWKNEEYYGFGLGAHGYIEGFRYENTRSITEYNKGNYRMDEKLLSKQEKMENELMLGLRLIKGINIKEFHSKFKTNIQDVFPVKPLIKNKDLIYKGNNIYLNPDKLYIMNEILLKLI